MISKLTAMMVAAGLMVAPGGLEKTPTGFIQHQKPTMTAVAQFNPEKMAEKQQAMLGIPIGIVSMPSVVKSVQTGTITVASATSNTATINSVDTSRSVVLDCGFSASGSAASLAGITYNSPYLTLTNATTVTATRYSSAAQSDTISFCVVEFQPAAVVSVQRGTITGTSGTTATATISSVTTSRAVVMFGGCSFNASNAHLNDRAYIQLTNATTVTSTVASGSINNSTVSYAVVEFSSSVVRSVAQGAILMNATSVNSSISAVTVANCLLLFNGATGSGLVGDFQYWPKISISGTTTVTAAAGAQNGSVTIAYSLVEFKSGFVKSRNDGTLTISSGTTATSSTFTAVNTSKTILGFCGTGSAGSASNENVTAARLSMSTTTVTATQNTALGSTSNTTGYNVVEFK